MIPIAEYSRDCLRALRAETAIHYDERRQGMLQLFRAQAQLDHTADDISVLKQYGVPYEVLDREGCIRTEPALAAVKDKIAGGLRLPRSAAAGRNRACAGDAAKGNPVRRADLRARPRTRR
jgi:D-amino-acid dehydrogenase